MNWRKWIHNILIGIDQFANTVVVGDPDETISSRAGKARREGQVVGAGAVLGAQRDRLGPLRGFGR